MEHKRTALRLPRLVADIGGTNARFGWLAEAGADVAHVATLSAAEHDGPASAAAAYLKQLAARLGSAYAPPRAAAFAVATVVGNDDVALTNNSGWRFSRQATRQALALDELLLLNDFEALALSLPRLRPQQLRVIGAGGPPPGAVAAAGGGGGMGDIGGAGGKGGADRAGGTGPIGGIGGIGGISYTLAVIGPGTGLGVAGIVHSRHGWVAVPGEGGHASLSAADVFDSAVLDAARREHPHVSAERLLSGIGLPVLHKAVAAVLGLPHEPLSAERIVERGLARHDAVCDRSLDAFCALLGSFAGNVALVLGARGGVFIGGGIVPRLGERFFASSFRARFEAKGRFEDYLRAIPTALITDTLAALTGAAVALEQHAG
ncbi:MAG: glucokinase [Rubrivivax sp.]|nr:glucokinase [Rubrivivax sp.]